VPLLPYVAWLGAIISWLTVVIEGVVAAPLWAFAHLDTEGEGMGSKAQHGYGFLMQVLFRPVLMVVGFLMMGIVMEVVGRFFFLTYPMAVADAGSIGSMFDLFSLLVVIGVFFTTSVMIINTCVNLVHIVPDTVLGWIAPGTQSAGSGSGMGGNFSQAAAGVAGFGGQAAQGGMMKARQRGQEMGQAISKANSLLADANQMNKDFDKARGSKGGGGGT
jgi:hypothetical protein